MSWATITLLCYYGSWDEIGNLFVHGCFSQENGSEAICHGRMLSWHILVGSPLSAWLMVLIFSILWPGTLQMNKRKATTVLSFEPLRDLNLEWKARDMPIILSAVVDQWIPSEVIKLAAGTSVQYYTFSGMVMASDFGGLAMIQWLTSSLSQQPRTFATASLESCLRDGKGSGPWAPWAPFRCKGAHGKSNVFSCCGAVLWGNCLMAYASAIALWCLIERPIMTLTTAGQCLWFLLSPCDNEFAVGVHAVVEEVFCTGLKPRAIGQKVESSNSRQALASALRLPLDVAPACKLTRGFGRVSTSAPEKRSGKPLA